ncbi:MAG: hypothetical protein A2Y10_04905 [Planctomycetes bacterium GWF2_41_51]|nr:MAG: hypothetical protein A2Y10_04905 [Planctomycetes bacterium GWF2_41_51]HBG25596.1 hypothetical protein [Phycisphaerales bacterium]
MKKKFYTPQIDGIIERYAGTDFGTYNRRNNSCVSKKITAILEQLHQSLQVIQPQLDGQDKVWSLWIRSKRGPMSAFINKEEYEEMIESGEIKNRAELKSLSESYYPEEIIWHKVSFRVYQNIYIFIFEPKLVFQLNIETGQISGISFEDDKLVAFLLWVQSNIKTEILTASRDIDAYNEYIIDNLPLHKRFGKIKRLELWEHIPEIERLDVALGETHLRQFEIALSKMDTEAVIPAMTADKFFHYCQLCYDANGYFKNKQSETSRSKYKKMADGRNAGLIDIPGNSEKAFSDWYRDKSHIGGHPWEICKGGNSTHISLIVQKKPHGWQLYLAGSSRVRVVETARMTIALSENKIPFVLADAQELLQMLKGTDYCGIVPKDMTPKYCHSCFPPEDKIIDFINPWHDEKIIKVVKKYATWYPLDRLKLA